MLVFHSTIDSLCPFDVVKFGFVDLDAMQIHLDNRFCVRCSRSFSCVFPTKVALHFPDFAVVHMTVHPIRLMLLRQGL